MMRPHNGHLLRVAVAELFASDEPNAIDALRQFTEHDWRMHLHWLDVSGMALYLIDHLRQTGMEAVLPSAIQARLTQNLADNRNRTAWLFEEMCAINRGFEKAGLCFANLKGMTLCPDAVPDPALRCQLDLDFIVAADQTARAQAVMQSLGYRLHAIGQGTWEFKAGSSRLASIADLYKAKPQRTAEIHFVDRRTDTADQRPSTWAGQLLRSQVRDVCGVPMRTLSPADQLLNQALHLFGHLRGEYTRPAWGLEFARHLRARTGCDDLWAEVNMLATSIPHAPVALGLTIAVVEDVFGHAAPDALRSWTVDAMPPSAALWARIYGRRALLGPSPGSKFHLLLEEAIAQEDAKVKTAIRRKLLPRRLPIMITHGEPGESLVATWRRYFVQMRFVMMRLRFHVVEGIRYVVESGRWRRYQADALRPGKDATRKRDGGLQRNDIF